MPLNVYEFSEAGSNRVAVAVAESAEAAERLANRMSPGRNWTLPSNRSAGAKITIQDFSLARPPVNLIAR
jgi:hypothetical protein